MKPKKIWMLSRDGAAAGERVHSVRKYKTRAGAERAAKRLVEEEGGNIDELLRDGCTEDARCCTVSLDEV